ncbi:MAG: hypothetical protein V2I46_10225 [Bacteroides sp.]|jgi:hypothetical protein|nr:hypothetical protein [Bacteroides sp.]
MKTTLYRLFFLFIALSLHGLVIAQLPYEVVMVRGKVSYKGQELKRGDRLELPDLDVASNMQEEAGQLDFGADQDFLQLLDASRRKIVVIPAQAVKPGRDLMLATRGVKYIRSDFEFQRAFSPGESALVLLTEDTVLCRGLEQYRFSGPIQLVAQYDLEGETCQQVLGQNDTLFLTRSHLFGGIGPDGNETLNSFEMNEIRLFLVDVTNGEVTPLEPDIAPFRLYFLDDIIAFFASARFEGLVMDKDAVYQMLVSNLITLRQIQQAFGIFTPEEAREWLKEKIEKAYLQYD